MLLREVEYARPSAVDDAVRLLASNEGARALAGGQTLVNVMKARAASPDVLVDLSRLEELRSITVSGDTLHLGAMATYTQIMFSSEVDVSRPILAEVAAQIADVQVRNQGTIGGNVCSNDPTNHLPPLLVALGASMTIGGDGTCIANAAASVADGRPRLALGCVDAVPVLVTPAAADEASVRDAVDGAGIDPPSDVHASADYRRHLATVCAVRAVQQATERGG